MFFEIQFAVLINILSWTNNNRWVYHNIARESLTKLVFCANNKHQHQHIYSTEHWRLEWKITPVNRFICLIQCWFNIKFLRKAIQTTCSGSVEYNYELNLEWNKWMPRLHSDPAAKHTSFRTRQRVVMPMWRHTLVLYIAKTEQSCARMELEHCARDDASIPWKKLKVKTETNEWLTKGILTSCEEKNRLYKIYKCNPTIENEQTYKIYKNKLTHIIRLSKKIYFRNKFDIFKNDCRKTWSTINEVLKSKNKKTNINEKFITSDGNCCTDKNKIVNQFNKI